MCRNGAGKACNKNAQAYISEVLKLAKDFDCKRLQSSAPIQCNDCLMHAVTVLSEDNQTVLHSMKQPDRAFAA
jgi:hypothetical protein